MREERMGTEGNLPLAPAAHARSHSHGGRDGWSWVVAAIVGAVVLLLVLPGEADLVVAFTNVSDVPMEVSVGGDRVRIIAPHDTEYLDVNPYAWAWPRKVEVRRYPHGERLLYWRADLTDLAQNHWRLRIP